MILIAEKIHASRVIPPNHPRLLRGNYHYGETGVLRVGETHPLKPLAIAANMLLHGAAFEQRNAAEFVAFHAAQQTAAGAAWLDINVDECSADPAERGEAMRLFVKIALAASPLPLSVDAADSSVLVAGLAICHEAGRGALLNSATPFRLDALEHAARFNAGAVLLPTPEGAGVPATARERCEILRGLLAHANAAGVPPERCLLDPVVMPAAMDPGAVATTLETTRMCRGMFGPAPHIVGGVGNVSYGLPARAPLNRVFAHLFHNAGADTAILDPLLTTPADILHPDRGSRDFKAALRVLEGEDEYAADYIEAHRFVQS
jgi:5-methyltetrahydrofolate--homocysteine methyltransferase